MSLKKRSSQSWVEDLPDMDIDRAADEVRTPVGKRQSKYGLAAHMKSGGGGAGKPPFNIGGRGQSVGVYDVNGDLVQKGRGGRGS
ncbi:unnamed protein product, partial [Scytosiphon promiscuus]